MPQENDPYWGLPDPQIKPEFYASTATKRLLAWFIDFAAISAICVVILPFTAFLALFIFPVLYLVVGFFYRVITISNGSATPGMRFMAIELRTREGARLDRTLALLHTLGYTLSTSMVLVQLASMALMATTPRGQGLSDLILGTTAINRSNHL
ncbi:RDD family protein [Candidatus Rhodobacter oscarellae]|uniref:RDD family protein n=1 Tax=Candidatus Rhodobacter oscarellae TaxID=1675527 RepID=A0A0J9E2Y4_9RHOB|nr:RDD family protein [Candidatus Rhodobacter lobularis]KMW57067.1 RDD family protein [Candidatus Rhodobacter lobularis]